jgi:hypothetical protein
VIGFSFGGGGIDGWLDPEETRLIAEHLAQLDLPRYERTFEAMEECHRRFRTAQGTPQEAQNPSFQQVSLSYVRTVAEIAAQQGHGILWGNDLPLEASAYHPYL